LGRPFWSGAKAKAVVVEADAFKESDVIYRAISSMGHHDDMLQTAELVNTPPLFFPTWVEIFSFKKQNIPGS
jgi:hypothetical protein